MKFELADKYYPSKQIIIFCAVWCSIGIWEIYLGCKRMENLLPSGFTAGCRAACSLCALSLVSAGVAQWQTHRSTNKQKNMQECKHTGVLSHLSLEKRNMQIHEALKQKKGGETPPKAAIYSFHNSCPNLTPQLCPHTLQGSFLTVPAYSCCSRKPHIVLS